MITALTTTRLTDRQGECARMCMRMRVRARACACQVRSNILKGKINFIPVWPLVFGKFVEVKVKTASGRHKRKICYAAVTRCCQ